MRIRLLAVGTRLPRWVNDGYHEYEKRLGGGQRQRRGFSLELTEIARARRARSTPVSRLRDQEGQRLLAGVPRGATIVALEESGETWTTRDLAQRLQSWQLEGRDLALLIGGPDGLSESCRAAADYRWSLSRMTLPHGLARVVVAEQLYRAWSLINNHPYHRD